MKGNWICSNKSWNTLNTPTVDIDYEFHTLLLYWFLIFAQKLCTVLLLMKNSPFTKRCLHKSLWFSWRYLTYPSNFSTLCRFIIRYRSLLVIQHIPLFVWFWTNTPTNVCIKDVLALPARIFLLVFVRFDNTFGTVFFPWHTL